MNRSSIVSLLFALVLAIVAVVGVQSYLRAQHAALIAEQGTVAPENTIVVAAQPLRFGKIIEPSSLRVIAWPSDVVPEGAFRTISEIIGESGEPRYVMSAIETAEPLLSSKITGPGQRATLSAALGIGMKAVSIGVNDVFGVAGFVLPGDRVDVMLTRRTRNTNTSNDEAYTHVLMQGVKVLAIDQIADDRKDNPAVVKTVTFEVSTSEAQKLTLAQTIGTLSLALRNVASSGIEIVSPVRIGDLGGGDTTSTSLQTGQLTEATQQAAMDQSNVSIGRKSKLSAVGVYRNTERIEYQVIGSVTGFNEVNLN